jgi:hypothetical protein
MTVGPTGAGSVGSVKTSIIANACGLDGSWLAFPWRHTIMTVTGHTKDIVGKDPRAHARPGKCSDEHARIAIRRQRRPRGMQ